MSPKTLTRPSDSPIILLQRRIMKKTMTNFVGNLGHEEKLDKLEQVNRI